MRLVHWNDAHGTGCVQTLHHAFCALTGRLVADYAKVDTAQLKTSSKHANSHKLTNMGEAAAHH